MVVSCENTARTALIEYCRRIFFIEELPDVSPKLILRGCKSQVQSETPLGNRLELMAAGDEFAQPISSIRMISE